MLTKEELAFVTGRKVDEISDEEMADREQQAKTKAEEKPVKVRPEPVSTGSYYQPELSVAQKPTQADNIIEIKNQNIKVSIIYTHDVTKNDGSTKQVTFSVTINAYSVETSSDGISMLIEGNIDIKPPTLIPMIIEVNSEKYNVVYAGAKHTLGKFINISFVRY